MAARHRAFTENIANVDTPGYKAKQVKFEEQLRTLQGALASNPENLDALAQQPIDLTATLEAQTTSRPDGNTVAIDDQVVLLEKNRLAYEALIQATRMRHDILHSAITETAR